MIYRVLGKNKGLKRLHCFNFWSGLAKYVRFQIVIYLVFSQL